MVRLGYTGNFQARSAARNGRQHLRGDVECDSRCPENRGGGRTPRLGIKCTSAFHLILNPLNDYIPTIFCNGLYKSSSSAVAIVYFL